MRDQTVVLTDLMPGRYWIVAVDEDGDETWLESYSSHDAARAQLDAVAESRPHDALRIERDDRQPS